ncbi:YjbH domain-containing protein [Sulfitobacter sp. S190]|uniref:YjbH domain-containing protein n=1 Tax=Sulfitobacter sp. S190 TaxID=2867022 RepID=UPI0021A2BC3C|nr:YjbH domain-containing protein [Sulfitobacter sp. S190]UWR22568.1 YjbH domain-containing protein [Sulfitobacter sp. S190]
MIRSSVIRPVGCSVLMVLMTTTSFAQQSNETLFNRANQPTLNFYGVPGLIDMPTGEALPDGALAIGVSSFGGITRTSLTFQATPRISASFRYSGVKDWDSDGFDTYRDRNFDVRFLLNRESLYLPAVTLGLQDLAGTGVNAGEFIAATKTFEGSRLPGTVKATLGLGWGRLGSSGGIGAPFGSDRPAFDPNDSGGDFSTDQWFRGEAAPFGGIEWQVSDRLGLKAEYSSDAYEPETSRGVFERESRFNFGAEYQVNENIRLGGYYLYGSEFGVNLQLLLNPNKPVGALRLPAPRPLDRRPSRQADPQAYDGQWAAAESVASNAVRDALTPLLAAEGLDLISAKTTASTTEIRYRNNRYGQEAVAVGRVARAMARVLPASVETFRITPVVNNLAQATVTLRRSDLEALETVPNATDALYAVTGVDSATPTLDGAAVNEDLFPEFNWSIGPYVDTSLFDPNEPLRADAGIELNFSYRFSPGWTVAGSLQQRLTGNIEDDDDESNSVLPRVRTDAFRYSAATETSIRTLYVEKQWKPTADTYARASVGYLERMFGGVSGEVLWKPATSRLALGAELNYARQRDFDQKFGFQDYDVWTGHASAYYELGSGYYGQLDVGQYLAGDFGATLTLEREFANGVRIGGFVTKTDVSSEEFGEGSFDKGIKVSVPLSWFVGQPTKQQRSITLRPLQRDGGARLRVPNRLYGQVRTGDETRLKRNFSGIWQ